MDTPSIPQKRCTVCKSVKPLTDFEIDKRSVTGYGARCRSCKRASDRRHYANNPKKRSEYRRNYYRLHSLKRLAYQRNYQQSNADRVRKYQSDYRHKNPDKARQLKQRTLARKRNLPATFTEKHWNFSIAYFNGACAYCGNGVSMFDLHKTLHREHHVPVSAGGGYTPDNIVPACQSCNLSKKDNDPIEWCLMKYGKRKGSAVLKRINEYFEAVRGL